MAKKRKEKVEEVTSARENRTIAPKTNQNIESLDKPAKLGEIEQRKIEKVDTLNPQNFGLKPKAESLSVSSTMPLPKLSAPTAKAEAMQTSGIIEKPAPTFSDLLAPARKSAIKEKTDAEKMQKYYALTSALNSIGKMGGAAIGGAIGGNALDSAPNVGEYKRSAGYLDAFEKAKKANDRLRDLDDYEFKLNLNKQQRDEDRAYKAEVDALDKQWQKDMIDYRSKIEQAMAAGNMELKAKYEAEAEKKAQELWEKRAAINHKYNMEEKEAGHKYSMWQADTYNTTPIRFKDGTTSIIPDNYYNSLLSSIMATQGLNKDDATAFIINNPELIGNYLSDWGLKTNSTKQSSSNKSTINSGSTTGVSNYAFKNVPTKSVKQPNVDTEGESRTPHDVVQESTKYDSATNLPKVAAEYRPVALKSVIQRMEDEILNNSTLQPSKVTATDDLYDYISRFE